MSPLPRTATALDRPRTDRLVITIGKLDSSSGIPVYVSKDPGLTNDQLDALTVDQLVTRRAFLKSKERAWFDWLSPAVKSTPVVRRHWNVLKNELRRIDVRLREQGAAQMVVSDSGKDSSP